MPWFGRIVQHVVVEEVATGYSYFVTLGVSFNFGSIFQNVVNPRFNP